MQDPKPGQKFYIDRGTQYTSKDFTDKLKQYKMIHSLSNKGHHTTMHVSNRYTPLSRRSISIILRLEHMRRHG
ncbi:hypothetical protein [Haloplasma contractile]